MRSWFHCPDLDGLLIAILAACSHYYSEEKPVWLMILGPSGSGKTEIIIECALIHLQLTRDLSDVNSKAFLSSWTGRGQRNDLLPPTGSSGRIWLSGDFTTTASHHAEDRKKVAGILRRIWDGRYTRDTGMGPTLKWSGKVTFIACATPEIEQHWGAMQALGERFLTLRWRSALDKSGREASVRAARRQLGSVEKIRSAAGKLISQLCEPRRFSESLPPLDDLAREIDCLAGIVATLRTRPERDTSAGRPIISPGTPEMPTRIGAALSQIARTYGAIFPDCPPEESLRLARRLALDTIPVLRREILSLIPRESCITYGDIQDSCRIPKTTLQRQLEELTVLGVLSPNTGLSPEWSSHLAQWSPEFLHEWQSAGL